ncbi:RagB/SusD family nutrient uptake outer membrane protein [Autumnicola psychrophila]|uniref:RagB/SusD family nutrient uptake outer membrane protein n=1 Tax=Autumnicola psychrophila TaxID=3075592 RepID=A0ABU3DM15_9FLAO|nr:RagB/SusD family nutrient uptake outer membrane protein [Zunongwangia sp. F225]MDT0684746.1 RagB/SusD family nutrient uptake outer membrane protein [Zunongwangia sp. F225]
MKRIKNLPIIILVFSIIGCSEDFLDLEPLDTVTESAYFSEPEHFDAATNNFYIQLISWRPTNESNIFNFMDFGSDLTALPQPEGRGSVTVSNNDPYWSSTYSYIRDNNIIIEKAEEYEGDQAEIQRYVSEAHFFRAWNHFVLLQRFGGVPIVTEVLDLDSPELYGARDSRYDVVAQILEDLDVAITGLPNEQNIGSNDKGKISKQAAQAFEAKVLLYEATWEKYVGTATDFEGSEGPEGNNVNNYLSEAIDLSRAVIQSGAYELWNYNDELDNLTSWFLFNLEDAGSNPAGLDKSTNREFIIQSVYDFTLRQGGTNVSHTVYDRLAPNRKMMDLFLAQDGLPIEKSPLFQGYFETSDEFENRDYRMEAYFGAGIPEDGTVVLPGSSGTSSPMGIFGRKFRSYNYGVYRAANEESMNYPQLRLAEVYLILAEALYERDGNISDEDLNMSINRLRNRAGIANLTNALVSENNLDMLEEIRRERAIELFGENNRYNDLKRWGIAEEELNDPIVGTVIEGTIYESNPALYDPSEYIYGEIPVETAEGIRDAVLIDPSSNRNFTIANYLYPLPAVQINLNPELVQNPGY